MTQLYGEAKIPNVDASNFRAQDPEFQELVLNLINIHVVSEDYGADCFEQSILRGPTPEFKQRMAKTVMEEYGHHLRFRRLLEELGIDWREVMKAKQHLSTFDTPIASWADQMVFLALVDRAAAHQFVEFEKMPYAPFRKAAEDTLREEHGHVGLGMKGTKWLIDNTPDGREQVKAAVMKWLPVGLQSFGADRSRTNERYRYWGIKTRTNEDMRAEYFAEVIDIIRNKWGVDVPARIEDWWNGKTAQAAGDGGYKYAGMSLPS
ncbi:MAG: phenylacetate-CoA oxygenase subunit PaaI [Rhodospirillaceae bacterium]|nr:phenylacetate-CoA oxygenase subunit PaaI [Rhodospirillaceae bacterium]